MNGFVNVNKAPFVSSAREVAIIKRLSGTPCGHLGTLDPMASGVLPIAIGNAARLFDYFLTKRKRYTASFRFGVDYDTLEPARAATERSDVCSICACEVIVESVVSFVLAQKVLDRLGSDNLRDVKERYEKLG